MKTDSELKAGDACKLCGKTLEREGYFLAVCNGCGCPICGHPGALLTGACTKCIWEYVPDIHGVDPLYQSSKEVSNEPRTD